MLLLGGNETRPHSPFFFRADNPGHVVFKFQGTCPPHPVPTPCPTRHRLQPELGWESLGRQLQAQRGKSQARGQQGGGTCGSRGSSGWFPGWCAAPHPRPHLFSFPAPGGPWQGWGSDVKWNLFNFTSHCSRQLASAG